MKLTTITPIYNEEYLLPHFIFNYRYVNKMIFLFDADTTDNSKIIIETYCNKYNIEFEIIEFSFGFDDIGLIFLTNKIINKTDSDYFICVDADEFIIANKLNIYSFDFCHALFYQMIPHDSENKDLIIEKPMLQQRNYGYFDSLYVKPCIVRKQANPIFGVGKHTVQINGITIYPQVYAAFKGMHLNMVNLDFAINRYKERCKRISDRNRTLGFGSQYFLYDENVIVEKFNRPCFKCFK